MSSDVFNSTLVLIQLCTSDRQATEYSCEHALSLLVCYWLIIDERPIRQLTLQCRHKVSLYPYYDITDFTNNLITFFDKFRPVYASHIYITLLITDY